MNMSTFKVSAAIIFCTIIFLPANSNADDYCGPDNDNEHSYKIPKISPGELKKLIRYVKMNQDKFVMPARDDTPTVLMEATPPTTEPSVTPADILRKNISDLEAWLQRGPIFGEDTQYSRNSKYLIGGIDNLNQALESLTAPPDLHEMDANILRAFGNLQRASNSGALDPSLAQRIFADLSAMTADITAQAISKTSTQTGNTESLTEARRFYDLGKQLEQARNYGDAIAAFAHAHTFFTLNFNMTLFAENLDDLLDGNVTGHAYVIAKDGLMAKTGEGGYARTSEDPPLTVHGVHKPQEIASVSKTITAVAVLQLLDKLNIPVDASIAPYLPASWNLHYSINNLSFRRLFTHTSGIAGYVRPAYYVLKNKMSFGVFSDHFEYSNGNYGLFRILIPALMGIDLDTYAELDQIFVDNPMPPEKAAAIFYSYYVKEHVLDPMGISNAVLRPRGDHPTLLYNFNLAEPGALAGNYSLEAGAFGWNLSAWEMTTFLINVRYNPAILSANALNRMYNDYLGWADPANYSDGLGQYGIYHNHGGDWGIGGEDDPKREAHTCIMDFPNGVQASVVMNSTRNFSGGQCVGLRNAFDNAWVWGVL